MDKKKTAADPSSKDCAFCDTNGAKLHCGKCKAAHYCSQACQQQHWKNSHKERCFSPEKRRPQVVASIPSTGAAATKSPVAVNRSQTVECPICLESISDGSLCTLPCKHDFHFECVQELRKQGVLQACPLCRAGLLAGPDKLFDEAVRKYVAVSRQVQSGSVTWQTLTASQQKDVAHAKNVLASIAHQGHAQAQSILGQMYTNGEGITRDDKEAVKWTLKAASQGSVIAQFNLGVKYLVGKGVAHDKIRAAQWFQKAAVQGHVEAHRNLGIMYREGQGVPRDFKEAAILFRKAAIQGNDEAQYDLGVFYREGKGVPEDLKEAAQWFRKSAVQGNSAAQDTMGVFYMEGMGISQDLEEGAQWFRKSAAQGFSAAQFHLGSMFFMGKGVARDYKEAARWFQKAAVQGDVEAQYNLGVVYWQGKGVPRDLKEADRWTKKAAAQGHVEAQRMCDLMRQNGFTAAAGFMEVAPSGTSSASQCSFCGRGCEHGLKLKPCSRCKVVFYCGEECQRQHWKGGHKAACTAKR